MYIYISKYVRIFRVFQSQIAPICLTSSSGLWMYLQVVPMTQLRASVENHPWSHFHDGRKGNQLNPLQNDMFFLCWGDDSQVPAVLIFWRGVEFRFKQTCGCVFR